MLETGLTRLNPHASSIPLNPLINAGPSSSSGPTSSGRLHSPVPCGGCGGRLCACPSKLWMRCCWGTRPFSSQELIHP